jgi:hypothetical protein
VSVQGLEAQNGDGRLTRRKGIYLLLAFFWYLSLDALCSWYRRGGCLLVKRNSLLR